MNNPGQYLKSVRKNKGLGVKAVYKCTGIGDSTIRRIEEGKTKKSPAADFGTSELIRYFKIINGFLRSEGCSNAVDPYAKQFAGDKERRKSRFLSAPPSHSFHLGLSHLPR